MADVVYVLDKRYFELFKVSCYSLIDKTTINININLLTKENEFTDDQQNKIINYFSSIRNGININFVTSELFNDFKKEGLADPITWYDDTVFLKCLLHDALPNVDWVTYLDCDTLIFKNIDDFLESKYDFPLAAPADINYQNDTDFMYVCLAVHRTSLKYWRDNNFTQLFREQLPLRYEYLDQDILNRFFYHNKVVLPLKYCAQNFYEDVMPKMRSLAHTLIVHFGGPVKPNHKGFSGNFSFPWHKSWKKYYEITGDLDV